MPRGGYRPGAGRPKKILPAAVQILGRPEISKRIADLPATPRGKQKRIVLALTAFGASEAIIAAVLNVDEECVIREFPDQLAAGNAVRSGSINDALWGMARLGNMAAISMLYRQCENAFERNASRRRMKRHGQRDCKGSEGRK